MISSSYPQVAEQIINFNNNVITLLSQINSVVYSNQPTVTVNITDQSGIAQTYSLPSFGYLQSEINRLNNNLNSIYSINQPGALIQTSAGNQFQKVVAVDLNVEPNDITNINIPTNFIYENNYILDNFLDPQLQVAIDLTGLVEDGVIFSGATLFAVIAGSLLLLGRFGELSPQFAPAKFASLLVTIISSAVTPLLMSASAVKSIIFFFILFSILGLSLIFYIGTAPISL